MMVGSSISLPARSQFSPIGFHTSPCGYCRTNIRLEKKNQQNDGQPGKNTITGPDGDSEDSGLESSASYYVRTAQLRPIDYQVLLNHGFRRSGTMLYKPEMRRSCCPHYTIRLPVRDLHVRKDQRSACNRWNKFVLGDDYVKEAAKLHPKSRAEKQKLRNEFNLGEAPHAAEFKKLPAEPKPAHRFEVTEEPSTYSEEKYKLYVNYQTTVHGETVSKSDKAGFKRFLCDSPLLPATETIDGRQRTYGSIHQCYRLDGRLIAMAVLDILPHGVSAVYMMYHSDFEQYSFGKLSALREANYAREHGCEFYYMGFYIHSCTKMRYKNDFQPQYFLDVVDKSWHRLDSAAQQKMTELRFYSPSEVASGKVQRISGEGDFDLSDMNRHRKRAALLVKQMAEAIETPDVSLFEADFAGMQTLEEVRPVLDSVGIKLPSGRFCEATHLAKWSEWDEEESDSIKGIIAALLACLGPEVNSRVVVTFG